MTRPASAPLSSYDVIVIGAGIQGTSSALNLALRGRRVLVIEKNTPAAHASGVNAGGVRSLWRHPAEIPLARASLELWRGIEDWLGADCEFHTGGSLRIAESEADMAALEQRVRDIADLGYAHEELLGQNALRAIVPDVAPHCVGGLIARNEGSASPYHTTRAFHARASREGVTFLIGERVQMVERCTVGWRVRTRAQQAEAPVLLNCAGAWGSQIAAQIGDTIPLVMEAPTMMVTERIPRFLSPVCGLVGRKLSFKQTRAGTLLIGGGHRGTVDRVNEVAHPDPLQLAISARTVTDVFPLMRDVRITRTWCGIEGMTPDHLPILGPSPSAPDAFHAFGFSAHGFALGPIVGKIMSDLIVDGDTPLPIAAFAPGRFSTSTGGASGHA
ncbi:MAG: NAD(P)/FAD-dependent oxidoreductase [Hyphomicrobiaceae bacterium]